MVIPTQKYAVIGVGWPVIGIFGDVVDLRPSSLHTTARNHTPAIAKRDCSALVSVEDSLFGAQALVDSLQRANCGGTQLDLVRHVQPKSAFT